MEQRRTLGGTEGQVCGVEAELETEVDLGARAELTGLKTNLAELETTTVEQMRLVTITAEVKTTKA